MGFASSASSSDPVLIVQGFGLGAPHVFAAQTTNVSSAITSTGFWSGCAEKGRGNNFGMRLGDILFHRCSTDSATPGRVTVHSVIATSANVASTVASSGFNAQYDATVSVSSS